MKLESLKGSKFEMFKDNTINNNIEKIKGGLVTGGYLPISGSKWTFEGEISQTHAGSIGVGSFSLNLYNTDAVGLLTVDGHANVIDKQWKISNDAGDTQSDAELANYASQFVG